MKRICIALLLLTGLMAILGGCVSTEVEYKDMPLKGAGSAAAPSVAVSEADAEKAQKLAKEAEKVMMDPKLPAFEKYPKALSMFNEALKVDPQNKLALDSKGMIEGIYESMGKPIPGTK